VTTPRRQATSHFGLNWDYVTTHELIGLIISCLLSASGFLCCLFALCQWFPLLLVCSLFASGGLFTDLKFNQQEIPILASESSALTLYKLMFKWCPISD
jgi:hypothetical protein